MTTSSTSPLVVNGIISGINTTQVIQALLQGYSQPITQLQDQQSGLASTASDYKTLNTDMQAVLTAAQTLNTSAQWNLTKANSSNTSVATATSAAGAQTGTASFTVNQLAQGNVLVSSGGAASESTSVTSASSLLVATGGAALGFSGLQAAGGLGLGSHTITVNQASSAATVTGSSAVGSTTVIGSSNNTLDVTVGGNPYTITLANGSYSPSALASAITTAAVAAGAPITASASASGVLSLSTTEQGSAASLTLNGGTALSALGLSSGATATGSDAVVDVDGTTTTLSAIQAGGTVTLDAPSGSITATVASTPNAAGSLVVTGTADTAVVSTGSGDLSDLVSNLNNAGLDLTASAVQDSSGEFRLQLSANNTGLVGSVSIDSSSLSSGPLAALSTIASAQNATVSVGGAGGYTLSSSTNTFSNLLQGTAITVAATGAATVTVGADPVGEGNAVASLVSAANQALSDINTYTAFNASTKTGGPLMGSAVVENLRNQISSIFASVTGTSNVGDSANVGITLNSDGTLSFNQATFESAFAANQKEVSSLFTQGANFAPASDGYTGSVSLLLGGDTTTPGTYAVSVSQSATQASDGGAVLSGGAATAAETLSISAGGASTSYTVGDGEFICTIATGLNSAFGANGLSLTATVENNGTKLAIASDGYGSASTFSVSSNVANGSTGLGGATANQAVSYAGTDVAGTINGVAATGVGQVLSAPGDDPTLDGLSVVVTATGISSATDLGSLTYAPGIAQQLVTAANQASNASNGALTSTINGLNAESTGLNSQITQLQGLEASQQSALESEFTQMEVTLGTLKNEGSTLTSAINNLPSDS